jgi:flagellar biosynthesis/type III secretory pathway protein FliH
MNERTSRIRYRSATQPKLKDDPMDYDNDREAGYAEGLRVGKAVGFENGFEAHFAPLEERLLVAAMASGRVWPMDNAENAASSIVKLAAALRKRMGEEA